MTYKVGQVGGRELREVKMAGKNGLRTETVKDIDKERFVGNHIQREQCQKHLAGVRRKLGELNQTFNTLMRTYLDKDEELVKYLPEDNALVIRKRPVAVSKEKAKKKAPVKKKEPAKK